MDKGPERNDFKSLTKENLEILNTIKKIEGSF